MSDSQQPTWSGDRAIDPDAPFGPGVSPRYHAMTDAEVVGSVALASLKLEEMANDPNVSADVVSVLGHLRDAVRGVAIYVGIDFD